MKAKEGNGMSGRLRAAMFVTAVSLGFTICVFGTQRADGGGPKASYIGSKICVACHKNRDDSVEKWQKSKHAKAIEALSTEAAKKFSKDPPNDPKCLACHTVGLNQPGGYSQKLSDDKKANLVGVGCESCHNAGSEYKKVMMEAVSGTLDHEKAMKAGLTHSLDVCVKCHNKNSPFFKEKTFDAKKKWALIKHGEKKKK